ncbi:MAG: glycosyltransferase family 4 protein [Nitrospirae bacterium]|nr:glycosyltransferase family 4 protein [Nitrospirota bacterium]MBF0534107.1 glycosyltransferase family 4 protein [Nitrospirota bacterium]MBF0616994.1 glycosyltransferase family 4 protein [Nitrospirota bacterium]
MKILFIAPRLSLYIVDTRRVLTEAGHDVDVLDVFDAIYSTAVGDVSVFKHETVKKVTWGIKKLKGLSTLLAAKSFLKKLAGKYDICHVHYNEPLYSAFFPEELSKIAHTLIVSIWGWDFHKANNYRRKLQERIYKRADTITFNNEVVRDDFIRHYDGRYLSKSEILRFGLTTISDIKQLQNREDAALYCRSRLELPLDAFIVAFGHNGVVEQQHEKMALAIKESMSTLPADTYIVFPVHNGTDINYIERVKTTVKDCGLRYKIIDNMIYGEELAALRTAADVMVHVQVTDSFSAAMQEHLYGGGIVINGSWLPYKFLKDRGVFFLEVNSVSEVAEKIIYAYENKSQLKELCLLNRPIMWDLSSWERNLPRWEAIYKKN